MFGCKIAVALIALGVGYAVCYLAKREEKALSCIGYVIGSIIILLSALLILKNLLLFSNCARMGKMFCPRMMQGMPPMAPAK